MHSRRSLISLLLIACVIAWALLTISFSSESSGRTPSTVPEDIDLSDTGGLFAADIAVSGSGQTTRWSRILPKGAKKISLTDGNLYFQKISPIDGIYYRAGHDVASYADTRGGKTTIHIGTGVSILSLYDPFPTYTIDVGTIRITPETPGTIVVSRTAGSVRIYSVDGMETLSIVTGTGQVATKFQLYPSLVFGYDPAHAHDLVNADYIRLSTVGSILSVDPTAGDAIDRILGTTPIKATIQPSPNAQLFSVALDTIRVKKIQLADAYNAILKTKMDDIRGKYLIDSYPLLFVNDSKKNIYYKNRLMSELDDLVTSDAKNARVRVEEIKTILAIVQDDSLYMYDDLISIMEQYYLLWDAGQYAASDSDILTYREHRRVFAGMMESLCHAHGTALGYGDTLANIFSSYRAGTIDRSSLEKHINTLSSNYIEQHRKEIRPEDYLGLGVFLGRFVGAETHLFTQDTLDTIHVFTELIDAYALSVASGGDDRQHTLVLSTVYYMSYQVLDRLYEDILHSIFDVRVHVRFLRKEYLSDDGTTPLVSTDIENSLGVLVNTLQKDEKSPPTIETGDETFGRLGRVASLTGAVGDLPTNRTNFITTLSNLRSILDELNDYSGYLDHMRLSRESEETHGVVFSGTGDIVTDPPSIIRYFSQTFKGVDPQSVTAEPSSDYPWLFHVTLSVTGYPFDFVFSPTGKTISNVVFTGATGQRTDSYQRLSISLDAQKKKLEEAWANETDPSKRDALDFRNALKILYLTDTSKTTESWSTDDATRSTAPTWPTMSKETLIFIQRELIDKDFSNIHSVLPIGIKNIYAQIDGHGGYAITLNNVDATLKGTAGTHQLKVSGGYIFTSQSHTFDHMSLQELSDDQSKKSEYKYHGLAMTILPAHIDLQDIPSVFKNLGAYLDFLSTFSTTPLSVVLDTPHQTIIVDGTTYPITLTH